MTGSLFERRRAAPLDTVEWQAAPVRTESALVVIPF